MGQSAGSMGGRQSKDELLYQHVATGNIEAIKALCREGASLEWFDSEAKTPLIVACMDSNLIMVAQTLIDLGANVNAYRPGREAGTPLHHAAKRGLDQTVKLLLSKGANALVRNDDGQTSLDVARINGYINVVRTIENHICLFSGWLRELHGPGFLKALAPQLLSRKIWVVIIPSGFNNPSKPLRLELVMYSNFQDAQPCTVIALGNVNIEEPKFHQSDPALIIFDKSNKTRYKLASANEGDKQQLRWLYNACRGIPQVLPTPMLHDARPSVPASQTATEAAELAMAVGASIQSAAVDQPVLLSSTRPGSKASSTNGWGNPVDNASHGGWSLDGTPTHSASSSSGWADESKRGEFNGLGVPESRLIRNQTQLNKTQNNIPQVVQTNNTNPVLASPAPSAPPIPEALTEGPVYYPPIDLSPVDLSVPAAEYDAAGTSKTKDKGDSSSCVICWEAPIEGACIPCGHMAGCMTCLNEIKAKKGVCPVCRAKIQQVLKLYAV